MCKPMDPDDGSNDDTPPVVGPDRLVKAFREEFPALAIPTDFGSVEAALFVLRKLYAANRQIMRGNVTQAMVHAVDAMPNGPDPSRPLRTIEPDPEGNIPRQLRDASAAWDAEFRILCQTLVNIGAGPGSPQEKQPRVAAAMMKFMGAHERVSLQFMCLRPPPER